MRKSIFVIPVCFLLLFCSCFCRFKNKRYSTTKSAPSAIAIYKVDELGKGNGQYRLIDTCGIILVRGKFKHGVRIGKWKFYDKKHRLSQVIKYDKKGKEIYSKRGNMTW